MKGMKLTGACCVQVLAAPAPGNNDAAQLAGQPTTTLDAEILVTGSNLTPFDRSKEQATANSVKAVLANYTTVVTVNNATVRASPLDSFQFLGWDHSGLPSQLCFSTANSRPCVSTAWLLVNTAADP